MTKYTQVIAQTVAAYGLTGLIIKKKKKKKMNEEKPIYTRIEGFLIERTKDSFRIMGEGELLSFSKTIFAPNASDEDIAGMIRAIEYITLKNIRRSLGIDR